MGATVVMCTECNKAHRYRSEEMENIGTEWHPIWSVSYPHCSYKISFDWGNTDLTSQPLPPKSRDAYERAESSDTREYWIQKYVQESYDKLGFSHIEGPFETGPDFKGVYRGRKAVVEVERECKTYILNRHHENSAFKKVNVLIVLNPSKLSEEIRCKLPKKIIYIDIDDFVEWWRPQAKKYAETKRIQRMVDAISGEFHRRFVSECGDKDRDMSVCPECDLCPYFGEGIFSEANPAFQRMAFEFIALYRHPITSDDFRLSEIDPSEINDYWHSATSCEQPDKEKLREVVDAVIIEVCGQGCPRCQATERNVLQALKELGVELGDETQVIKIKDIKQISARGVVMTPAILIDEVKVCEGRIPSSQEVMKWIEEKV